MQNRVESVRIHSILAHLSHNGQRFFWKEMLVDSKKERTVVRSITFLEKGVHDVAYPCFITDRLQKFYRIEIDREVVRHLFPLAAQVGSRGNGHVSPGKAL